MNLRRDILLKALFFGTDGILDKKHFTDWFGTYYCQGKADYSKPDPFRINVFVERMFTLFDTNKDGIMSFEEYNQ